MKPTIKVRKWNFNHNKKAASSFVQEGQALRGQLRTSNKEKGERESG
jgi:hypothetical protein